MRRPRLGVLGEPAEEEAARLEGIAGGDMSVALEAFRDLAGVANRGGVEAEVEAAEARPRADGAGE